jgi:hypothetical protein
LWAHGLGGVLAALGAPEFPDGVVYAGAARAIYLNPAGEAMAKSLSQQGEPSVPVRGALVFVSPESGLPELTQDGVTAQVVYEDPGEFYDAIESLTEPQRQRDIAARLARSPQELRRARRSQIDRLHLHQILMKLELAARPDGQAACSTGSFRSLLAEEVLMLERSLYSSSSFTAAVAMDAAEAATAVDVDSALFQPLAQRYAPPVGRIVAEVRAARSGGTPPAQP